MSKALEQAQEGGYTVDKLTPTSDGDILWEQDSNRFVLVSDGKIIFKDSTTTASIQDEPYKFWKITNEDGEIQNKTAGYSYYLGNNYSGGKMLTVKAGLDVGDNDDITSISYTNDAEQSVIFNTIGGTLTVDAPNSDVKHYGSAEVVNVNKVAENSYHLYGSVSNILTVQQGHVYFESTSYVDIVKAEPLAGALQNSIIIDGSSSAQVGQITMASTVGLTVKVAEEYKDYVEYDSQTSSGESLPDIGNTYFSGGMGTERSPFRISSQDDLLNVDQLADEFGTTYYFLQTDNIEISASNWFVNGKYTTLDMSGIYDGGNNEIKISESLVGTVNVPYITLFNPKGDVVIKNLKTCSSANCLISICFADYSRNLKLENISAYSENDTIVQVSGSNAGPLVNTHVYPNYYGYDDFSITIDNCHVNLKLNNSGDCTGVFIGGDVDFGKDCKNGAEIQILNSSFTGTIQSGHAGLIFGNGYSIKTDGVVEKIKSQLIVSNVVNNGVFRSTSTSDATMFGVNNARTRELHEYFSQYITGSSTYTKYVNVLENVSNVNVYKQGDSYTVAGDGLSNNYTYRLALTTTILADDQTEYSGRNIMVPLEFQSEALSTGNLKVGGIYLEADARAQGIIPADSVLDYDHIYDAIFTISLYVDNNNNLYIIMKDPGESGYPKPQNNIFKMNLFAYDAEGYLVGRVAVK